MSTSAGSSRSAIYGMEREEGGRDRERKTGREEGTERKREREREKGRKERRQAGREEEEKKNNVSHTLPSSSKHPSFYDLAFALVSTVAHCGLPDAHCGPTDAQCTSLLLPDTETPLLTFRLPVK